jgi:cytochrome c oxidase subunit II
MHIDKYERYWIIIVAAALGVFFAALLAGALIFGVRAPDKVGAINPNALDQTEFANPGIFDMGDNHYNVYMVASYRRGWIFDAGQEEKIDGKNQVLRFPQGAKVTFYVTSEDITHGFIIEEHNANVELVPGQIARVTTTFNRSGTFHIQCHEYCGSGHQGMWAQIIVEPAAS